jgi:hypothetical protein
MSEHERDKKPKENPSPEPLRLLKILHFLPIVNPTFFPCGPGFHRGTTQVKTPDRKKQTSPSKKTRKKSPTIKKLTPNAVVQRVKFGESGVSVCIDDYGEEGSECFTEGTVIYINRQHPLYQREAQKADTYLLNVARLITQEISLMKDTRNPRQAFQGQSKLLRDAFIDRRPE